ncbi:hypothetical protein DFH09DRAFT_1444616 [Mycena vulgaris]|nr:hypothetical protein DFH09DRAFT_1444616 [Mycena vulgaris]
MHEEPLADMDPTVPLLPTPVRASTDLSTAVHTGHPDSTTAIAPPYSPDPIPIRPPLPIGTSSSLSSASTVSAYSQDETGYAPLASTVSLANPDLAALIPASGALFTPIPPLAPHDVAYFPVAGALGESAATTKSPSNARAAPRELVGAEGGFDDELVGNAPAHMAAEAQRAVFSDAHFGVLGREDSLVAASTDNSTTTAPASGGDGKEDGLIFTAYGLHLPAPVAPATASAVIEGDGAESSGKADGTVHGNGHGNGSENDNDEGEGEGGHEKGKGRRSRFVAKLKEKMHV